MNLISSETEDSLNLLLVFFISYVNNLIIPFAYITLNFLLLLFVLFF